MSYILLETVIIEVLTYCMTYFDILYLNYWILKYYLNLFNIEILQELGSIYWLATSIINYGISIWSKVFDLKKKYNLKFQSLSYYLKL